MIEPKILFLQPNRFLSVNKFNMQHCLSFDSYRTFHLLADESFSLILKNLKMFFFYFLSQNKSFLHIV